MIGFLSCFFLLLRLALPESPDAATAPGAPFPAAGRMAPHADTTTAYGYRGGEPGPEEIAGGRTPADTGGFPSLIDFGDGAVGYRKDTVFTIFTSDTAGMNPAVQVRPPFTLSTSLQFRDTAFFYIIYASYHPAMIGDHVDTLQIAPGRINQTVTLHGRAESSILPFGGDSIVDMGDIPVRGSRDTVGHIGLGDLEILRIDTIAFEEDGAFQCIYPRTFPVTLSPANGLLDSIVVRASGGTGRDSGTLVVRTNMGVRTIRFAARFTDTSSGGDTGEVALNYASDTLDFGEAEIGGGSAVRRLTIVNTRSEPAVIDTLFLNDLAGFAVEMVDFDPGASIPAGDSAFLRIGFAPLVAGTHQGRLEISGGGMRRTLHLFGTGIRQQQQGPDSIFVGEVEMGSADSCRDTTIVIAMQDTVRWLEMISDNPEFAIETTPALPSPASDTLRVTVRFCWESSSEGMVSGDVFLVGEGGIRMHLLRVAARVLPRRNEPRGTIVLLGDTVIRFNQVDTGSCADRQILLMNTGTGPAVLDSVSFDGSGGAFTMIDPPAFPRTLLPREGLTITVRFCPMRIGEITGRWRGWQEGRTDTALAVTLLGHGRDVALSEEPGLLLGDASVRVGEPFRLPLSLTGTVPPNTTLDHVRLVFNRRSLWFRNAFAAGGGTLRKEFENDSTLLITGDGSAIGPKILDLEFIGLSTGVEVNSVRVDGIILKNIDTVRLDTAEVILIGCDLVEAGGFTKKIAIKAIAIDPLSSSVGISYDAPQGAVPLLGLIDISGARVMQRELPHGDGDEQRAQLQLGELSPGLYLLELRVGNDRSTVPILVRGR